MKTILLRLRLALLSAMLIITGFPAFSQGNLKAFNDTIDLYPGVPRVYDILANDSIPIGDTVKQIYFGAHSGATYVQCQRTHDSTWRWVFTFAVPRWGYGGDLVGSYRIFTSAGDTGSAAILFRIHDKSYAYLDINNVSARFNAAGNHFYYDSAQYEVPKGSGKTSVFSNALWIGGKDVQNKLHFAGERYQQGPNGSSAGTKHDFFAGPVMDSANYSIYQDTTWNYIWNVKKSEIEYHRAHFWEGNYIAPHDILTWPGNGDPSLGQAPKLAPFSDRNGNGVYEPYDGDYPEIRGDQALFFIFNDDRGYHAESTGTKLRVEIHGMAYAFDMPGDSAFKNTVFLNYKIFNRSQNTYDSTLLGVFTDIDLGYANDDYLMCDVERNMFIGYNGDSIDGTGLSYTYGDSPPAQGVVILGGPYMDADGIDNPRYDLSGNQLCDFSVNGMNFGDSIADNERYGLQRFLKIYQIEGSPSYWIPYPAYDYEYYNFMQGKWKDNSPVVYGGNGHSDAGGYGPACRFMFPGESDTLNWGVGCVPPNGPVNWTEETALNSPQDRRGVEVTGPFTFKPGDIQELDLEFCWARAYGAHSPMASVEKLRHMADKISRAFIINHLPGGDPFYGIGEPGLAGGITINIYPNPASEQTTVVFSPAVTFAGATLDLVNSQGYCLKSIILTDQRNSFSLGLSEIPSGFYFLRISTKASVTVHKVVIIH